MSKKTQETYGQGRREPMLTPGPIAPTALEQKLMLGGPSTITIITTGAPTSKVTPLAGGPLKLILAPQLQPLVPSPLVTSAKEVQEERVPVQAVRIGKRTNCFLCGKKLFKYFNLLRHLRTRHPVWFDSRRSKTNSNSPVTVRKKHVCDVCDKSFLRPSHVLRHKRTVHKIDVSSLNKQESSTGKYECHMCARKFSCNANRGRHLILVHKISPEKKKKLKCSECMLLFSSRASFLDHVQKSHDISVDNEKLQFDSMKEFDKWKAKIEINTSSKFIKGPSYKLSSGNEIKYFICHRNGQFKSKSTGKRRSKLAGTYKIDYFCPAHILVKSEQHANLFPASVTYCSLHLGHKCEATQLPLTKRKKDDLADHLSDVPFADNKQFSDGEASEELNLDIQSVEVESEKCATMKGPDRNTCKNYQNEAKKAVFSFFGKLKSFNSEEQCKEIIKTMSELTYKCEAIGKRNKCALPVQNPVLPNKNSISQRKFSAKKKVTKPATSKYRIISWLKKVPDD